VLGKQLGEQPHHHLAVLEHVAHAAGHAQVVFQHVVGAAAVGLRRAHDVDARDMRVDLARQVHTHHLGAELAVLEHVLGRHDAGLEDLLTVVDVVQEAVQRRHALRQALLHAGPFIAGDDARDQVEGDQPLGAGAVFVFGAVDREGDADAAEDHLGFMATRRHLLGRAALQPAVEAAVMGPNRAGIDLHLVKSRFIVGGLLAHQG